MPDMSVSQPTHPSEKPKRIVQAPQTDVAAGTVLSVELTEEEDVQWQWSHGINGQSQITGYRIVQKPASK